MTVVEPLTAEEIQQLEMQHDKIARMLADLDGASIEAEAEFGMALAAKLEAEKNLGMARIAMRTIRDRRMGLSTLLRRYPA